MGKLNDYQAGFISQETYQNDQEQILIDLPHSDERIIWKTVDIIEGEDTGLYGYVLENAETNEVVISFRGTEMDKGLSEMIKDFDEDLNGVVLGDSDYTDVYEVTEPYTGSRAQIQSLYAGRAKYDVTEQSVTYTNKNQFSEAEAAVKNMWTNTVQKT